MKWTIFVLAVLVLAVPVLADTVSIEITDEGGGIARIDYAAPDSNLVRAFALNVTVDTNIITACTPYLKGECNSVKQGFGIFPGTIDINAVTGIVEGFGTPVADPCDPDLPGQLGTSSIVLEMGSLYSPTTGGSPNAPGSSGTLCWLEVAGDCNMSATVEGSLRGGIVMEDAGVTVDANLTQATGVLITTDCLKSSDPGYTAWADYGKPDCWCYRYQCKGDVDGTHEWGIWISSDDLDILKTAFNVYGDTALKLIPNGICADIDHLDEWGIRVSSDDLDILKIYFNQYWGDTPAPSYDCPTTHINFWKN